MKTYHRDVFAVLLVLTVLSLTGCRKNFINVTTPRQLFNDGWEFLISGDSSGVFASNRNMPWEKVTLPHTPVIEPVVVNDQWQGTCWYRKSFVIPEGMNGKRVFLKFEGAMNVAEVWINGTKKIKHLGGYLPFVIDFTREAIPDITNQIIVRLDNTDNPVTGPKPLKQLDFNMYGGLYRDVYFIIKEPLYITDPILAEEPGGGGIFVTYPEADPERAKINIRIHIKNDNDNPSKAYVINELWKDGRLVATVLSPEFSIESGMDHDAANEIILATPSLWSPASPSLYHLVTSVISENNIVDTDTTRIGIRRFDIAKDRFEINGEEKFLRGVNRHQEYPYVGYALSNEAQYRDAVKIKEAGFDYVRLSHYPQSPAFMNACDELGLLVLDAIPGWQYYIEDEAFKTQVLQTCRDMIRRDRNHACVLAWEVSLNESWMAEEFIDRAVSVAKEEYPGDQCFTAGWMQYGYDIFLQARQHRVEHYEDPGKPYIVSEYGDWEYYAMNAGLNQDRWGDLLQTERSSRQLLSSGEVHLLQQATNIQEAHNDNFNTPAFADGYWVMFDYNRGYADNLEASGIMSIERIPKFSYYFFRSQRDADEVSSSYSSGPLVFIATYWNEDSPPDIRVFSNCEEVELRLNDKLIARQAPDSGGISSNLSHPPFTFKLNQFTPGTLTATGYIDGKEAALHDVTTPGDPFSLELMYDESRRPPKAGCNDVIFLYARLIDENGTIVPVNGRLVKFTVTGGAEIIKEDTVQSEAGIAAVLIRIGGIPGEIRVDASAEGMTPETVMITSW